MVQRLDLSVHVSNIHVSRLFQRTGASSTPNASTLGANTLCHISLREVSSTRFFRFTFCAMDSFHLCAPCQSCHSRLPPKTP